MSQKPDLDLDLDYWVEHGFKSKAKAIPSRNTNASSNSSPSKPATNTATNKREKGKKILKGLFLTEISLFLLVVVFLFVRLARDFVVTLLIDFLLMVGVTAIVCSVSGLKKQRRELMRLGIIILGLIFLVQFLAHLF